MEEDSQPKTIKKGSKCVLSPFAFTVILCFVLGLALVVVPIFTFKSEEYVKKIRFDMTSQFFVPQKDRYDAFEYTTSNASNSALYVFKAGTKLQTSETSWAARREVTEHLKKGDAIVIPFLYVEGSYMEVEVDGDQGCHVDFKNISQEEYEEFHPSGTVHVKSGAQIQYLQLNHTFTSFGKSYGVVQNSGADGNVTFKFHIRSPVYNVSSATPIFTCEKVASCTAQTLPRGCFGVVNYVVSPDAKTALTVSVTLMHNDKFRWGFPCGVYGALVLIVVLVGVGQLIVRAIRKKNGSGMTYQEVEDPLIDKQDLAQGDGTIN